MSPYRKLGDLPKYPRPTILAKSKVVLRHLKSPLWFVLQMVLGIVASLIVPYYAGRLVEPVLNPIHNPNAPPLANAAGTWLVGVIICSACIVILFGLYFTCESWFHKAFLPWFSRVKKDLNDL